MPLEKSWPTSACDLRYGTPTPVRVYQVTLDPPKRDGLYGYWRWSQPMPPRLESACKQYGANAPVIPELTFNALKATYKTREIDKVIVKGKTEPVGVYEVLDYHTPEAISKHGRCLGHLEPRDLNYSQARQQGQGHQAMGKGVLKANPE